LATRLYFHVASSAVSGTLPTTEQSSLTAQKNFDAQTVNRTMNTTIGTSQDFTEHTAAHANGDNFFIAKWVSPPINAQTISANTWDYNFSTSQSSAATNFPVAVTGSARVNIYVWRPSTGAVVGTILDGQGALSGVTEPAANTQKNHVTTFSGSSVTALLGDVIIFEAWVASISNNNTGTKRYYFDGNTVNTTENTTVSNHASFIETPQNIDFNLGPATIPTTVTAKEVWIPRMVFKA
jgi:hypothetical protein